MLIGHISATISANTARVETYRPYIGQYCPCLDISAIYRRIPPKYLRCELRIGVRYRVLSLDGWRRNEGPSPRTASSRTDRFAEFLAKICGRNSHQDCTKVPLKLTPSACAVLQSWAVEAAWTGLSQRILISPYARHMLANRWSEDTR